MDNIAISESIFIESSSVGMEFSADDIFDDKGENVDWNAKGGKVCLEVHEIGMVATIISKSIRFFKYESVL